MVMAALTCEQVLEQIELFAADETDAVDRTAVERHVADCPRCAEALADTRRMLGLLTLRLREPAGLERLQQRIAREARKQRPPSRLAVFARVAAVAAVLLLTFGVYTWVSSQKEALRTTAGLAAKVGPSPGAAYKVRGTHEVEVEAGEVFLRTEAGALTVRTPAGDVTAREAAFIVDVAPKDGKIAVRVLEGKVKVANARGNVELRGGEMALASQEAGPERRVEDAGLRFARAYQEVKVKTPTGVPAYSLPVDLAKVTHYQQAVKRLDLGKAESLLRQHGFAVLPDRCGVDLLAPYAALRELDVPMFLTADTLLHLHRLQLADLLADIEEHRLADDLAALTATLLARLEAEPLPPAQADDWAAARRLAIRYISVGHKLLRPDARVDADVASLVKTIEAGKTSEPKPGSWLAADFTDFRPVGHYARAEKLQRYFRAMMWFSRMPLLLGGGPGEWRVSAAEARQQTMAAALVALAVHDAALADGKPARAVWQRIDGVTAFFVGVSAEPGPPQYYAALTGPTGTAPALAALARPGGLAAFQREVMKSIPQPLFAEVGKAPPAAASVDDLLAGLRPTTGFRLFGPRFTPDAEVLARLTYPNVGGSTRKELFTSVKLADGRQVRGLPRGLDLMALLGSPLARHTLRESGDDAYEGYDKAFDRLRAEFARLDVVDWNRNLWWSWLYALQPLLREPAAGAPTFMTGAPYEGRLLNTALASWTQRRRDTVLYTKRGDSQLERSKLAKAAESITKTKAPPTRGSDLPAYLEPVPAVYARLLALTRMARQQLAELDVLDAAGRDRLEQWERDLERLLVLAEKQLDDQPLSREEQDYLHGLPASLRPAQTVPDSGRLEKLVGDLASAKKLKDEKRFELLQNQLYGEEYGGVATPLLVRVATDASGQWVLQEAIGRADLALVVVRLPGGELALMAGPVLSHFELKAPRSGPWTDDSWLDRLAEGQAPPRPEWTRRYLVEK
jgi:anti-sigma factor RsiW